MPLRVLIGGEATRTIAAAFEARGHYALTADFRDAQRPGPHHKGDWKEVEGDGWDLAIFHRTCTYMANSSAKHLYRNMAKKNGLNEDRFLKCLRDAWEFWNHMETCPVKFAAWENPVMLPYAQSVIGKPLQTVQPWWFGTDPDGPDNVKKATCWWVKGGLPKLRPTGLLDGSTARAEVHLMAPTDDPEDRRMERSKFTPGHAAAMADQWGEYVARKIAASKDTPMTDTPIRTTYVNPPIPYRQEDWWAQWSHHDGEDTLRGSGETELSAVIDLLKASLDEDEEDDVIDMAARYWTSLKD